MNIILHKYWVLFEKKSLQLPNLILVLNIFVKAFCYDLTPFGFICTNHMCGMS